ncbi:MAG: nitrate/nitrite transporter [Gammaproteobacteria bacterium]
MNRYGYMFALIIAGEAIFALPFHVTRFFRPTVLEVFALTPTELGAAQAAYGVLAMLAYFPGGAIADRFPAHKLLAFSLWSTAAGGLYMATFPNYQGSLFLWSFFGISTILLFWAAMIRATREWGGITSQGKAFGLLDGGRGLLAAALASVGVLLFSMAFPDGTADASLEDKKAVLRTIIYGYTAVTAAAGVLVWFVIRGEQVTDAHNKLNESGSNIARNVLFAIKLPAVWLQALIVVCAYVGYKGFDNYSLFAVQAYGLDEIEAARIVTIGSWMRPVAAIAAGLIGDRFGSSKTLLVLFALLLGSDLFFALSTPVPGAAWAMLTNTVLTCIAIFGFRGLYFTLFEEAKIPMAVTGTAVGIVSVIGYMPDIFVTLVAGILIDRSPGLEGHQQFFMFLSAFALAGLLASFAFSRLSHRQK